MKKYLALTLALLLCLSLFSGCGNKAAESSAKEDSGISYVMIYNPTIYDDLSTGDLKAYVDPAGGRGDDEEVEPQWVHISSPDLGAELPESYNPDGNRAEVFLEPYQVGDAHTFFCGSNTRAKQKFSCEYAGEHCNIWLYNCQVDAQYLTLLGEEFDGYIYGKMTEAFGEGRFVENGGKLNILVYPFEGNGTLGFFHSYDMYATGEVSDAEAEEFGINLNHAMLNINYRLLTQENIDTAYATLAHEYQHLLARSAYRSSGKQIDKWMNEAMSGFVEEWLYPGIQVENLRHSSYMKSKLIRNGQSLYNFNYTGTDIGVYGSVWLFTEYMANEVGDDVFSDFYGYWKTSRRKAPSVEKALAATVSENFYDKIDNSFDFSAIEFDCEEEEWMSKLALNFHLSVLCNDPGDPEAYAHIKASRLLYKSVKAAEIEGGGRIIVALKDGKFAIPEDADEGLIYIGLDENFEMVDILSR